jgi:hypothetical protein
MARLVDGKRARTARRWSRKNIIFGGLVVLGTYIRLVLVVDQVDQHHALASSIFGRSNDLVASRAMWPKQIWFRLMMRIAGD